MKAYSGITSITSGQRGVPLPGTVVGKGFLAVEPDAQLS